MRVTFDPAKRDKTLAERGLDFAEAGRVWDGITATIRDDRFDYSEHRFITAGFFNERMVVVVWTSRGKARHIISMRHAHAKEQDKWRQRMG